MNVVRGGDTDRWDIQVRLGPLGSARLRVAVEEHGQGRQLVRYRVWPRWSRALPPIVALLALWVAGCAGYDRYLAAAIGVVLLLVCCAPARRREPASRSSSARSATRSRCSTRRPTHPT